MLHQIKIKLDQHGQMPSISCDTNKIIPNTYIKGTFLVEISFVQSIPIIIIKFVNQSVVETCGLKKRGSYLIPFHISQFIGLAHLYKPRNGKEMNHDGIINKINQQNVDVEYGRDHVFEIMMKLHNNQ